MVLRPKGAKRVPKLGFSSLTKNDLQSFSDVLHKISVVQSGRIDLNHVFRKNLGFEVYGKNGHEMEPTHFLQLFQTLKHGILALFAQSYSRIKS